MYIYGREEIHHQQQQMGFIKISLLFFFLLRVVPYPTRGEEICPIYQWCTKDEPTIRFPFIIKGRTNEVCGYPGYEITCNEMNKTVLELPFSGKFFVRNVYSFMQKIEIYDPDICLPNRILKMNLSGTPYQLSGTSYRKYSFLNCSSSIDSLISITKLIHIGCLSSSTHTVIATDVPIANIAPLNTSCVLIADVPIPNSPIQEDGSFDLNKSFFLSWPWLELPPYLTKPPKKGNRRKILLSTLLSIFIGLPLLTIFLCYGCPPIIRWCKSLRARRARVRATSYAGHRPVRQQPAVTPQPVVVRIGLSDSTLQSYPQVILGESGRLPNPNNTSCAICIADFQPKDTLKSMPTCNHCFHANCLEQWLRLNATCPICRKSPLTAAA